MTISELAVILTLIGTPNTTVHKELTGMGFVMTNKAPYAVYHKFQTSVTVNIGTQCTYMKIAIPSAVISSASIQRYFMQTKQAYGPNKYLVRIRFYALIRVSNHKTQITIQ